MYRNRNRFTRTIHRITRTYGSHAITLLLVVLIIISGVLFLLSGSETDQYQNNLLNNNNNDNNDSDNKNIENDYQNIYDENNNNKNKNDNTKNENFQNNPDDFDVFNNEIYNQERETENDENKCKLCNNLLKSYGNSSPNDLVITGVFGKEKKFDKFIRSLRSTGCKAKVVVVSNVSIRKEYEEKYKKCDVDFFIMKSPPNTMTMYPHSLRYVGYQQYFDQLKNQTYDRVLHADSFDVFFQKDPFTKNIRKDRLYFTMEDVLIQNSTWNSGWLTRAYNDSISTSLGNFTVSCSGTLIGGYSQFLIYLKVLLGHPPFWANGRHSLDQAYHNYLLHTSAFKKAGINPEYMGCNSDIVTMHYCGRIKQVIKRGYIYTPNGQSIPAIVHQYPLFQSMSNAIKKMCS